MERHREGGTAGVSLPLVWMLAAALVYKVRHDPATDPCQSGGNPGELVASCQRCHHDAVLPVALVLARYGPTTPFPDVKGRFRYSACSSNQVDVRPNWSRRSPGQIIRHTDHPARRDRWLDDEQGKDGCPTTLCIDVTGPIHAAGEPAGHDVLIEDASP